MAKAIMIQGTMSNAGKSFLAAGLCRIFRQDGYRVSPFKSQNMALNSFITKEGLEMGRAQAVQAEAAGIEPAADMNPVLLKPSSDTGSQVIVRGIPVGTMSAREYFRKKKSLVPVIMESYRRLNEAYDIIVIEGAGSPAEINLKQDDIVNMGIAELAGAPVLLAGDIDRGGVFAQLYGTVMLLSEKERAMVKGLLINKFRGDKTILDPGVEMLEKLCGIPVAGVIPWMDVDLEDEDSLSSRLRAPAGEGEEKGAGGILPAEIAAVRFPRLSNFTDLNVFSTVNGIQVRYVDHVSGLGNPDLIVLPGTKNTMEDLLWMRQNGLEAAVKKAASKGTPIWGICGGYQMMGERLFDMNGAESGTPGRSLAGMGLFPCETRFYEEKIRTRVRGRFGRVSGIFPGLSGMEAEGYEIHMGQTVLTAGSLSAAGGPLLHLTKYEAGGPSGGESGGNTAPAYGESTGRGAGNTDKINAEKGVSVPEGFCRGLLYGTYLHGIFDAPGVAEEIADALLKRKGYDKPCMPERTMDYRMYREIQYERLALVLREHLDMGQIYRILEQGAGTAREGRKGGFT